MTPTSPEIINRVVDTLDLRLSRNRHPSAWLLRQVTSWRAARDAWEPGQEPPVVRVDGVGSFVLRGSSRPFEFVLVHPEICDIRIWNPERWSSAVSTATGQIMFNFRSKFLQLVGLAAAREVVRRVERLMIASEGALVYSGEQARPDFLRVARGDLAADVWQDRDLRGSDLQHFVCQSRSVDTFYTLSTEGRSRLLESVLGGENELHPPMDNKGVSIRREGDEGGVAEGFTLPMPGPYEAAAASVLDAFCSAVREELEDKKGARVTRAVMRGREPQTVYFGQWKSPIFCKVYNKLASLKPQRKLYMLDVWASNGWDGKGKVWRWEYTFTGDFLKSIYVGNDRVDVREFDDFLAYLPALWFYVTRKWLRQVDGEPNLNKETQRMRVTHYWGIIQSAWDSDIGVERDNSRYIGYKNSRDAVRKIVELRSQALGCIISAMAIRARLNDLEVNPDFVPSVDVDPETGEVLASRTSLTQRVIDDFKKLLGDDFDQEVFSRQRFIGLDDLSDSALTSLQRAERMAEGFGS